MEPLAEYREFCRTARGASGASSIVLRLLRFAFAAQCVAAGWFVAVETRGGLTPLYRDGPPGVGAWLSPLEGGLLVLLGLALALGGGRALLLTGFLWAAADCLCAVVVDGAPLMLPFSRAVRFVTPLALLLLVTQESGRASAGPRASRGPLRRDSAWSGQTWLRLAAAATFAGHGAGAIAGKASFVELVIGSGQRLLGITIQGDAAREALLLIGTLDVLLAALLLTTRWNAVAGYMAFWATVAAAGRITAYGWAGVPEAFLRSCNAAAPLALALWGYERRRVPQRPWVADWLGRAGTAGLILAVVGLPGAAIATRAASEAGGPAGAPEIVNLLPEDGSTVPARANLCVQATDASGDDLTLTFYGRDLSVDPAPDFTLIALPDTQAYAQSFPAIFNSQTAWVVEQREALNIAFVTHLGDVVETGLSEFEWRIADAAFSLLEDPATTGLADGVPYGIAVGSHDQGHRSHGTINSPGWTTTLYNQYFGLDRFAGREYFGGHFRDNNDNSYQLFSASGMDFIVLHLEYEKVDITNLPLREQVLDWAEGVLAAHPGRRAILSNHFLLNWFDASWTNQGQAIYDRLKHHPNLFLMLCAHLGGEPRRTDTFGAGTVHTLMSDYQFYNNGGDGYLRIYTFSPEHDTIESVTYSPWLDQYRVNDRDEFTVTYDMQGGRPFTPIGTVENVPSGSTACVEWTGRTPGAAFEWYASAAGHAGAGTTRGAVGSFGSTGECQTAADCVDQDPCTGTTCDHGQCIRTELPDCCQADVDCDDRNACTDDACEQNLCRNVPHARACTDGNACTGGDVCADGVCAGTIDTCDDGNDCTLDTCFEDACLHDYAPSSGCCAADADCRDLDPCTVDTCAPGGTCVNAVDASCCVADAQCDDGNACTEETCTPTNAAAFRVNGNEHINFRPKGYWPVTVTSAAAVWTLELWFKWDGGGSLANTSELVDGGLRAYPLVTRGRDDLPNRETNERSVNYFLGILDETHVLVADFEEHDSGSHPGMNHPVTGTTPVTAGTWHHAAMTYDGACWQLYLDGQPETDGANCPREPPNYEAASALCIGAAQDFQGWIEGHFSGLLDEVRLWNRALTPAEIQAHMHVQVETHPELIARWGLNEVVDLYVLDSTGNGHTGVAVGGSWETLDVLPLGGNTCAYTPPLPRAVRLAGVQESAGATALNWVDQGPGTVYDVVSGALPDLRAGGSGPEAECLADAAATPRYDDPRVLPPGDGVFYLVRAASDCSVGDYGAGSSGAPRTLQGGCP